MERGPDADSGCSNCQRDYHCCYWRLDGDTMSNADLIREARGFAIDLRDEPGQDEIAGVLDALADALERAEEQARINAFDAKMALPEAQEEMRRQQERAERAEAENERLRSVLLKIADNAEKRGLIGFGGIRQMLGEER